MKLIKVGSEIEGVTTLADVDTGQLYTCRDLRPVTVQQASGHISEAQRAANAK